MTDVWKKKITNHYYDEYFQKALGEKKSFLGKVLRWETKNNNKWARYGYSFSKVFTVGLCLTAGFAISAFATPVAGLFGGLAVGISYLTPVIITEIQTGKAANKAIDQDIENGTLPARYKSEVFDPERLSTENQLKADAAQLTEMSVKAPFAKAALVNGDQSPAPLKPAYPSAPPKA